MELGPLLLLNLGGLLASLLGVWLLSLLIQDVSIVDVFWGIGFVLVAGISVSLVDSTPPRAWLLAGLTFLWGLRLAGYLGWRKFGKPEDQTGQHRLTPCRFFQPTPERVTGGKPERRGVSVGGDHRGVPEDHR